MEATSQRGEMPVAGAAAASPPPVSAAACSSHLLAPPPPTPAQIVAGAALPASSRPALAAVCAFRPEPLEETPDRARILTTGDSPRNIQVDPGEYSGNLFSKEVQKMHHYINAVQTYTCFLRSQVRKYPLISFEDATSYQQEEARLLDDHPEQDSMMKVLFPARLPSPLPPQGEVVKQSRLLDDHPEQDSMREVLFRFPSPPRPQAGSDVSETFVKKVEDFMKGVRLAEYGTSESEKPPTIYKVPDEMKGRYKEVYNPIVVWIGLFNDENETRDVVRSYKWCCLRKLISRHHLLQEPERTPILLRRCFEALEGVLPRIISSYVPRHQQVEYDPGLRQSILEIMLRDGCFILHRLIKYARIAGREAVNLTGSATSDNIEEEDDDWTQVFGRCWVWGFVTCDLLLLENQIPFFVMQKLFQQLRTDPDESSDVLVAGALRLFRSLRPRKLHSSPIAGRNVHHLLHLFYLSVGLPEEAVVPATHHDPCRHTAPPSELPQWIPSARELEEAGVKFRARKDAKSFLDVRFHGGVLEIPELELYDYSEPLFRNLIAFEQTYPFTPGHVTAYAIFMDCLVTSPEDMRLLHLSGVLVNQMNGERDAAGFFSRLCAEAHLAADHNYLAGVILDINRYQQSRWPRWRTALVRNYFSNPWVVMSLVAAILLLALTMMQSFFSAYAYFKPPKQQ